MSTTTTGTGTVHHASATTTVLSGAARKALAVLRIAFGLTFLWAFVDKLFALGFSTGRSVDPETGAEVVDRFGDAAWMNGASPTEGFLGFGADGPFKDFYNSIAGAAWADWLFMTGLLGIGLALALGIGMRVATVFAAVLYAADVDGGAAAGQQPGARRPRPRRDRPSIVLLATAAGTTWGLGREVERDDLVSTNRWLR